MEDRKTEEYGGLLRELLEQKQYTKLRQEVADMNVADVAAVMDEMEDEESLRIFRILLRMYSQTSRSRCSSTSSSLFPIKKHPTSSTT